MANLKFDKEITALLVIDPYNGLCFSCMPSRRRNPERRDSL